GCVVQWQPLPPPPPELLSISRWLTFCCPEKGKFENGRRGSKAAYIPWLRTPLRIFKAAPSLLTPASSGCEPCASFYFKDLCDRFGFTQIILDNLQSFNHICKVPQSYQTTYSWVLKIPVYISLEAINL
ncbi:mCG144482, partial [Mus musculus]